ncbi:hypothetical protein CEY09_30955 [Achromobacter marplatensis]|uniref:DUF2213 domain-containing protein n=1 Tax=Achromobacter marplatensis TaxID=470868 RepID=A0ABX9FUN6_9BURK|nr:DUF2213 domain-containing protein [Achromobacter marplatensis]OWT54884.1 hypothetical protein CEY09_30955 [Achromobacter marplatensis]RBP10463.1 hypothetical protein DFP87_12727 [Achromobacter marplatensis]CAB3715080.1 hypothetical protein LMG26219_06161 [Achromobacter marplatensis]
MKQQNQRGLAFDRATVRRIDVDGRMHVEVSNISKATVNPYRGDEIPDWEALGLDPNRVYFLLRDPEELARAAPTFNNIPLLSKHIPVSAAEPQKEFVVGATGSNASYQAPYLKNSLVVWDAVAIALVESDEQKELSSAYRYRADMTPGKFEGVAYDGVMRDIRGNHVALVEVGRAGPDVVVGDSYTLNPSEIPKMKQSKTAIAVAGALGAYIRPKLAQDSALGDLTTFLKGVSRKNLKSEQPRIVRAMQNHFKGKLAQDADLEDLKEVIEVFTDPGMSPIGEDEEEDLTEPKAVAQDDELMGKIREMLGEKLGPEEAARVMAALGEPAAGAEDEPPHTAGTPPAPVTKQAMDQALAKAQKAGEQAAVARWNEIRTAEQECRPILGEIVAQDSAEAVYKMALDAKGIDLADTPPSAYRALVKLAMAQDQAPQTPRVAMDSAAHKSFRDRFPHIPKVI